MKFVLFNKVFVYSVICLSLSQISACGLAVLPAASQLSLGSSSVAEAADEFAVLAAKPAPKQAPAPKKPAPPPKPLPKAFMDALKKYPALLAEFNKLKDLPPHEHYARLQVLLKDYPQLLKLVPKPPAPPAGAPSAAPSGAPHGAPPPAGEEAQPACPPPPADRPDQAPPPPEAGPEQAPPPAGPDAPPPPQDPPEQPPAEAPPAEGQS